MKLRLSSMMVLVVMVASSAFSADFPLLIQFEKGANPNNKTYAVEGFASVNGTPVPGEFILTNTGQTQTANVDTAQYKVGDVITVTGGYAPASDDVKKNGKLRKHDRDGKFEGNEAAAILCPAKQIHVVQGGTTGFLECGPVEFVYNPDTNSCVTVCN